MRADLYSKNYCIASNKSYYLAVVDKMMKEQ